MRIRGTVQSGAGQGTFFVQLDWVVRQCRDQLGFTPYPGTLNVEIGDADLPDLQRLLDGPGPRLVPEDPAFCAAQVRPVTVGGIPAAVVLPAAEVRVHGDRVVELVAPCSLKAALGLRDGDEVTIVAVDPGGRPAPDRYRELYEFAASAGALEGFAYPRRVGAAGELDDWVRNLAAQYRELPEEVRRAVQPALDRTLGRAAHSLAARFGADHPHVAALRALLAGDGPADADDFAAEIASKRARRG